VRVLSYNHSLGDEAVALVMSQVLAAELLLLAAVFSADFKAVM
jgi:hypothetical protein